MGWFCTCCALAQMSGEVNALRASGAFGGRAVIVQQPVAVAAQPVMMAQQPMVVAQQPQPQPTAVVEPQKDHTD